jgi:hypothetical protein
MTPDRATGDDDPALAETTWPMPGLLFTDVNHKLCWAQDSTRDERSFAAAVMAAYRALICDGTTEQQVTRLRALRRVQAKRRSAGR